MKLCKSKKVGIGILSLLSLVFIGGGVCTLGKQVEISKFSTNADDVAQFAMIEGASVRLQVKGGAYGIRFGATVADREQVYTFMIVPKELTNGYGEEDTQTLSEYCETVAASVNGTLAKKEGLTADEDGCIYASLVEVKWENLNREFCGIAYYIDENTGKRIETFSAEGSERSIKDVAELAVQSGDLSKAEQKEAQQLVKDAEKQSKGVVINSSIARQFFSVDGVGDVSEWSGKNNEGWMINGEKTVTVHFDSEIMADRLQEKGGMVKFSLRGQSNGSATFYNADSQLMRQISFTSEAQEVTIPSDEFKMYEKVVFEGATGADGLSIYYMGEVSEESAKVAGTRLEEEIVAIIGTEVTDSNLVDVKEKIAEAQATYNNLSESAKGYVESYTKLSEFSKSLEKSEETETIIYSVSTNKSLLKITNLTSSEAKISRGSSTNANGVAIAVWSLSLLNETAFQKTELQFVPGTEDATLKDATKGYDDIAIEVYIDGGDSATEVQIAFTAGTYDKNATEYKKYTIKKGEWTRMRMTRAEFLKFQKMTLLFWIDANVSTTIYIGNVIGITTK